MQTKAIARVEFSDATTRLDYEDAPGQYFMAEQAEPTYGVWFVPPQELDAMFGPQPIVVDGNNSADA